MVLIDVRLSLLKITNIPWDLTSEEVITFLDGCSYNFHVIDCNNSNNKSKITDLKNIWNTKKREHWSFTRIMQDHIHIPIDRLSGKTRGELFVECGSPLQVKYWITKLDGTFMGKRIVRLSKGDWNELIRVHFASYTNFSEGKEEEKEGILLGNDVSSLLEICKNYKGHFSRKCVSRPFEHVISLFRLSYWWSLRNEEDKRVMYTLGIESLKILMEHLERNTQKIGFSLLYRLLKVVLEYEGFNGKMLESIRDIKGIQCLLINNLFITDNSTSS